MPCSLQRVRGTRSAAVLGLVVAKQRSLGIMPLGFVWLTSCLPHRQKFSTRAIQIGGPMIHTAMVVLIALVLLTGCAARVPLDASGRRQMLDGSVHAVSYPAPAFSVITAGRMAMAGLFGPVAGVVVGLQAESEGKERTARLGIPDPSAQVRDALVRRLTGAGMLRNVELAARAPSDDGIDDLRAAGLRPLVLDSKTVGWSLMYYGTSWGRYRVVYVGRARLLDVDAGKTLWQGRCEIKGPDDPAASPTLEEFRQPDGRVLREKIEEAVTACVEELVDQLRRN